MKGLIPLDKLTDDDLREIIDVMERRHKAKVDSRGWPRASLIAHIQRIGPPPVKAKPERRTKKRMPRNEGVAKYCREILTVVVGKDLDGHPVGLSYQKMTKMAQKKFPLSCVDERHLRWYACQMRSNGMTPPVHRERSRWTT